MERLSTLAGDNADQRRARRQQHTRPVPEELRAWLDAQRAVIPPKTPLGAGLGYLHRQWQRLVLFLDDGNIEATNTEIALAREPPTVVRQAGRHDDTDAGRANNRRV